MSTTFNVTLVLALRVDTPYLRLQCAWPVPPKLITLSADHSAMRDLCALGLEATSTARRVSISYERRRGESDRGTAHARRVALAKEPEVCFGATVPRHRLYLCR
jgi:hypothetical protein